MDRDLIEAAIAGDKERFADALAEARASVMEELRAHGLDSPAIQDAIQDAYMAAWVSRRKIAPPTLDAFRGHLVSHARRVGKRWAARERRRETVRALVRWVTPRRP